MSDVVTLKQNTDFHRAYGRGKSKASSVLVTYAVKNRCRCCRVGITTSKKIGSAVERNRCRRIIRAAFSAMRGQCVGGYDIVFVARAKTKHVKTQDVQRVMYEQLTALGVIKTENGEKEDETVSS
ncbi:MAG: ribonuclease P protein component [Clostridia bacterium]|nr:ribonuclease P protein component [Clostridia bacterium]